MSMKCLAHQSRSKDFSMQLYTVSTLQLIAAAVLQSVITASCVIYYDQYKEKQHWPQVTINANDECIKVVNFNNGEAYNCQDIDIVLRQYVKVLEKKQPEEKVPVQ